MQENNTMNRFFERRGGWHRAIGIVMTLAGVFWLAKRAGWIPMDHAHPTVFWPLVTIALGLFLVFRVFRHREKRSDQET